MAVKIMKNFFKTAAVFLICLGLISPAAALVQNRKENLDVPHSLHATSFTDYAPFGYAVPFRNYIVGIYSPLIDQFAKERNLSIVYTMDGTYKKRVFDVISGKVPLLLGAYYDTKLYEGLTLLYPSLISNPLVLVTMSGKPLSIKTKEDLKTLKGGMESKEYLADYVKKDLEQYNISKFESPEKLYEQLAVGNIDYVITSRYYGTIELAKLGLYDHVKISKNALWDMPMFLAVSQTSPYSKSLIKLLQKYNSKPGNREMLQEYVDKEVQKAIDENRGVVPPAYIK